MEFEQLSIFDFIDHPPELKIEKPIRLIELFAGIGAQAAALERLGANFEHYRVCEFDKYAIASYNAIHGTNFETSDIREIHASDLGIVNRESFTYLLTYSFPCTDLSVAGRMEGMSKGSGTRSGLLWEVERLLEECGADLPQILVMENVPQVHGTKNIADFQMWLDFLSDKGYTNVWQDLNAMDYGVAQSRNRTFMVSFLGNYTYEFPKKIPLTKKMKDYLEETVEEKFYISSEKADKLIQKLLDTGTIPGKEGVEVKRSERKCIYCENLLGKKGCLGMCNKHYIQYKRWGDPLHSEKKERATVDGYYRDGKTGRREHRIIYEQYYGILLSDEEVIHHINFVKTDNRIENLWKYPNASEHTKAHWEYEKLYETLSENEEIYFENGHYLKRERERVRTDRPLTCASNSQQELTPQMPLLHDTTAELAITARQEAAYLNYKGIEKIGAEISCAVLARDYKGFGSGHIKSMGVIALDEQNQNLRQETFGTLTTDESSPKHNNRVVEITENNND